VDIAHSELVEQQLTTLIERRHERRVVEEGERAEAEAWAESVRRYNDRLQEENRAAWAAFHEGQAERHRRTLEDLIEHHTMQAEKLLKGEA
jgi:hypothetical protein